MNIYERLESKLDYMIDLFEDTVTRPMTRDQAAAYLNCSVKTINNLVSLGKLRCYKPNGKDTFFKKKDLDAYAYQNPNVTVEERESAAVNIVQFNPKKRKAI